MSSRGLLRVSKHDAHSDGHSRHYGGICWDGAKPRVVESEIEFVNALGARSRRESTMIVSNTSRDFIGNQGNHSTIVGSRRNILNGGGRDRRSVGGQSELEVHGLVGEEGSLRGGKSVTSGIVASIRRQGRGDVGFVLQTTANIV